MSSEKSVKVTSVLNKTQVRAIVDDDARSDEQTLGALGYKQEFKRDLTILESFSISFSILGLLPSIASTLAYGLGYSGTGGLIWGWLIAGIMIQSVAFSMAELCSAMPTAGGLYYAAAVLAPEGYGPACAWFVGWSNAIAFSVGPCSLNYALATMITTAATISDPGYVAKQSHVYLIYLAILVLNGLIAMQSTKFIGRLNVVSTVWNILLVLVFLIWFPAGAVNSPKTNDTHETWTSFQNGTEWPIGWATIMGFLTAIYTMAGYDAPFHLAEECSNANIASPRAIVLTSQSGLYLGWAVILVIGYTVKDITEVVAGPYGQPFGALCLQVLGKRSGLAMFSLTMIGQFFCGQGVTIAASRVIFAYSRDGAIIGSRYWSKIDSGTKTPVLATWGVLFISALFGLISFGGPVAIGAVFTLAGIGQYTAFVAPIALKLFFGRKRFRPGPWHLGRLSMPLNAIAVAFWCVFTPALCWPAYKGSDLTLQTMNWTVLIYVGVMGLAMGHYLLSGRKWFKGPKINVAHLSSSSTHTSA
ncbi:Putative amino acid/polyamine transporter I [Septoria linicola]|uniref:Amino acid/polyamine transporter I n=1 Tax=Septoria linicola TaxID=215465 RepID=A0A9Q9ASA3_9PEZI|nr:putative amino acid/polyamine transporter I [Septoria linicola]USW53709.1 Putative amino acid/polyamine transporter I [Septoria linicola]